MDCSRREFLNKGLIGFGAAVSFSNSWASATTRVLFNNDEPDVIIELIAKYKLVDTGNNSKTKFIILSYNSEGLMDPKVISKILSKKGKLKKFRKKYRRFRTERDHEKRRYKVKDDIVEEQLYLVKIS